MFTAILDRLLVRPDAASQMSAGGILLDAVDHERPMLGEVLAAGPGRHDRKLGGRVPMTVQVGDRVLYHRTTGVEIRQDGEKLLVMKDEDILGVLE